MGMRAPAGNRRASALLAAALAAILALAGAVIWRLFFVERPPTPVRIATGSKGGTYLPLGTAIAEILNDHVPHVRATAIETAGSRDNMRRLEAREVELALVQNDTPGGQGVRAIAPLYQEVLHMIVRAGGPIEHVENLARRRVAVGPAGSGTEGIARVLFDHFRLEDVVRVHLGLGAAVEAFERGEIDAVFALTGMRAPAVERLLTRSGGRLLSLGNPALAGSPIDAVRIDAPYLTVAVIPQWTYGREPPAPVGTLGVQALLVAHADLPEDVVHDVTEAIFQEKVRLAEREKAVARLSEHFDPGEVRFPLHPGAIRYYKREGPAFIQEWAEPISLGITVVLLAGSGALTAREALRRRKKNRIDVYYLEIYEIAGGLREARRPEELLALKDRLKNLRRRAFEELVAERLEANESFTIFQDFLSAELEEVEAAIAARRRGEAVGATGRIEEGGG